MTSWEKQILPRAIRIQREIGGDHAFFSEITELKFEKKMLGGTVLKWFLQI